MTKKRKQPWPTKAAMRQIYDEHLWGGQEFDFYSGEGSHNPKITEPYLEAVISFLKTHQNLTVCDLGCGDFNIGKHLAPFTKQYLGIDIVDDLIKRNKELYSSNRISFDCLDISNDKLPLADCIVLRQVLQHLSNAEIERIVNKIKHYKYLILTEHLPSGDFEPNKDIISGQGIRLKHDSAVDVLKSPFNLRVSKQTVLNKIDLGRNQGQIVTTLFRL